MVLTGTNGDHLCTNMNPLSPFFSPQPKLLDLRRAIHSLLDPGRFRKLVGIALLAVSARPACVAQPPDLTQKSLEDLMNIEVTSVSKKEQRTSQVAAAVFVISKKDIRHSGALNIPDLLRMVPGLDVAQIDIGKWAISARGFNGQYSNKLLVLIDGRTVYTSIFAGVFWDSQNVSLDTIERIEVIRGPGAAVWGSNAVNGVINIITRSANDTQGGYLNAGLGTQTTGSETISYGGKAHGIGAYRISAEGFHYNSLPTFSGLDGKDDWRVIHGGFRTDSALSARDSLTTEGDAYQGIAGEIATTPVSLLPSETATVALHDIYSGWNLLGRWNRTISSRSDTSLQVYFDRTNRADTTYSLGVNTFDIDFQQHVLLGERQDIVWGLGYRLSSDDTGYALRISYTPEDRYTRLFSVFGQDEIVIRPDRLHLSLGGRVEHNDYTGFDFQPSARMVWTPDSKNTVWGAISGAERTPSRSDTAIRVNYAALPGPTLPVLVSLFGNPNKKNERLTAFEVGYRNAWTSQFSVDATAFYNRYRDVDSVEPRPISLEANPAPVHILVPSLFGNGLHGETHGIELFANWNVTSFWNLSPGYSFISMHLHPFAGSQDFADASGDEGGTPDHQAQLRSNVRLPHNLQWNTSAYFVNRLPAVSIPSYTRVDTGLIWHAGERVSMSVVGQNLLKNLHPEYAGPSATVQTDLMRRAAYAKITWTF
jgi:iron complex outermembrane receptor protein